MLGCGPARRLASDAIGTSVGLGSYDEAAKSFELLIEKYPQSEFVKEEIQERFMSRNECPGCHGARLKKEALAVKVGGLSISELCAKDVKAVSVFFENLPMSDRDKSIARRISRD